MSTNWAAGLDIPDIRGSDRTVVSTASASSAGLDSAAESGSANVAAVKICFPRPESP